MDFTGYVKGLSRDFESNMVNITFQIDTDTSITAIQSLNQFERYDIHVAKHKNRRSLDANAYLWVLCGKIASKVHSHKDAVYEEMLQRYGVFYKDDNGYVVVTVKKDVDMTKVGGHWKLYRQEGLFNSYLMIKGSSEYNTEEMTHLLDGVIDEAKTLDIDTVTITEKDKMLERWAKQYQ